MITSTTPFENIPDYPDHDALLDRLQLTPARVAALAADMALLAPRASMIAVPRRATVGMKSSVSQWVSAA